MKIIKDIYFAGGGGMNYEDLGCKICGLASNATGKSTLQHIHEDHHVDWKFLDFKEGTSKPTSWVWTLKQRVIR